MSVCLSPSPPVGAYGIYTHDRYAFRTPGNCNTILTVKATTMPPKVTLYKDVLPVKPKPQIQNHTNDISQLDGVEGSYVSGDNPLAHTGSTALLSFDEGSPVYSINFQDNEVGSIATRLFFLSNASQREVAFSILGDSNGIFQMFPKQGKKVSFFFCLLNFLS
jgi:hypothetical protein